MGRDALIQKRLDCQHDFQPIYEDDILMGMCYYGDKCNKCGATRNMGPGPLDLGVYK